MEFRKMVTMTLYVRQQKRHRCKEQFFGLWRLSGSEVTQSCPTLCNPMDCSLPGSSLHGILQARVLEWVAISFSRGSSQLRDWTQVSLIPGRCFNLWAAREVLLLPLSHLSHVRLCATPSTAAYQAPPSLGFSR